MKNLEATGKWTQLIGIHIKETSKKWAHKNSMVNWEKSHFSSYISGREWTSDPKNLQIKNTEWSLLKTFVNEIFAALTFLYTEHLKEELD